MKTTFTLLLIACLALVAQAQYMPQLSAFQQAQMQVAYLGTFHFDDAGLDEYKPKFTVDILEPRRQRELDSVLHLLAAYKPTHIALETRVTSQAKLDSLYTVYRQGGLRDRKNEVYQIGLALAHRLGHTRVYAVDAPTDGWLTKTDVDNFKKAYPNEPTYDDAWQQTYKKLYSFDDSVKTQRTLLQTLRYINHPARVRVGHGHYLVSLRAGHPASNNYIGADDVLPWFKRNARILSNILRLRQTGHERVLVLIGAGHLPYLQFLTQTCPDASYVPIQRVLGE